MSNVPMCLKKYRAKVKIYKKFLFLILNLRSFISF
jgi:hypothetical protein